MKNKLHHRKGSLFLLLMVTVVFVGGITASKVAPQMTVINQRNTQQQLQFTLGEFRAAIALERIASATPLYATNWNTGTNFKDYLNKLVKLGFLRKVSRDPTAKADQWDPGPLFWLPSRNLVASSGFEADNIKWTVWATGSQNIVATLSTEYMWPGDGFGGVGHSLIIIKP